MTNIETLQYFIVMVFFGMFFGIFWSFIFDFAGWD
jgi:hypothetical protein